MVDRGEGRGDNGNLGNTQTLYILQYTVYTVLSTGKQWGSKMLDLVTFRLLKNTFGYFILFLMRRCHNRGRGGACLDILHYFSSTAS